MFSRDTETPSRQKPANYDTNKLVRAKIKVPSLKCKIESLRRSKPTGGRTKLFHSWMALDERSLKRWPTRNEWSPVRRHIQDTAWWAGSDLVRTQIATRADRGSYYSSAETFQNNTWISHSSEFFSKSSTPHRTLHHARFHSHVFYIYLNFNFAPGSITRSPDMWNRLIVLN